MTGRMLALFFLLASSASAQLDTGTGVHHFAVRIVFSDGAPCDSTTQVTLTGRVGSVGSSPAGNDCLVEFYNLPAGAYHLTVSGVHFATVDAGPVAIDATGANEMEVKINRADSPGSGDTVPEGPMVGAAELAVPSKARKEFHKGSELIDKQDFRNAIEHFEKAISIYPAYAEAYNNLSVAYARLGDHAQEKAALEKALSIDDHLTPAYVNLGRMNIKAGNLPAAETALNKAHALDPNDGMTVVMLAYVEFTERRYDGAIASSRQAHSLPKGQHSFVHQIAARAFEQKHDTAGAISELELFLKEEQPGPRAEAARKELADLQAESKLTR